MTGTIVETAGEIRLLGDTLTATAGLEIGLFASLSGSGTIAGNVTNNGEIMVGTQNTAGILTVTGNYSSTTDSTLVIGIGGLSPGSDYDQIAIGGTAYVNGTLTVSWLSAFAPVQGNGFDLLTFNNGPGDYGSFSTVNVPPLGGNLSVGEVYNQNSVSLQVQ